MVADAPISAEVPPVRRRGTTPVPAYLGGFVMIGLGLNMAGPALSHLRDQVHTNDAGFGWAFVGSSAGYILGSVYAGHGLDNGDGHRRWVSAMAAACVAILLIAAAPNLILMVLAFAVLGAACGLCDVSGNTLVMWSRPDGPGALLNALHLCFAIGAMATPLIVNRSLHWFHSVWGVAVPMALIAGACAVLMLRHPAPQRTRLDTVERSDAGGERGVHVAVICLFFFAYVAMETGFMNWIHTYVEEIHYGTAATATGVTTMFGVGFVLGRVLAIVLARRFTPGWIVAGMTVMSVLSAVLFVIFDGAGPMLWIVTFLFAVSVAPQYASMMAFAESHLALSGRNTSALVASSGIGGLVMPWSVGQLFHRVGPQSLPPTILGLSVLTAVVGAYGGRLLLRAHRPPVTSMKAPVT